MSPSDTLPALRTVERLLRETTERIAGEFGLPSSATPRWTDSHWRVAQAAAVIHGVSPLLSRHLQWRGPDPWQRFLGEQWQQTFTRQQAMADLIARIDAQARDAGIAMAALKGAALHELKIYEPGLRPMADLDILVHPQDVAAAVALLEALGFGETYRTRRERVFQQAGRGDGVAFGESVGRAMKVELHTRIVETLPIREVEITELILPQRDSAGVQHYRSLSVLMTHLLLHAAGNIRVRALRLIHLYDVAALASRLNAGDWSVVLGVHAVPWWIYPPLALTARYFPSAVPAEVLSRATAACPTHLRRIAQRQRLSDVSLSYPWIDFCPGSEWCGSMRERMRYLGARAFPNATVRAEVRINEANNDWARNSAWTRLSRPRRLLRRVLARAPRVQTLWSVREAWQRGGQSTLMRSASLPR